MYSSHVFIHAMFALALALPCTFAQADDDKYKLGPDSEIQEGVPQGEVTEHVWRSKIFPDTIRRYWTYVPKQYDLSLIHI